MVGFVCLPRRIALCLSPFLYPVVLLFFAWIARQVPRLAVVVELEVAVEVAVEEVAVAVEAVGVRPGLQAVGNTGVPSGGGWLTGRSWT
jgi:hypothetical protein